MPGRAVRISYRRVRELATMELTVAADSIQLRLQAKPGEKVDATQTETCLDSTTTKLR